MIGKTEEDLGIVNMGRTLLQVEVCMYEREKKPKLDGEDGYFLKSLGF